MKLVYYKISAILAFSLIFVNIFAQPAISSFQPNEGPVGTEVVITGTGFDSLPTNNIVFFGATQAIVLAATISQLTVIVPIGATFQPITVLVGGLVAYSSLPFIITFEDPGINGKSFATYVGFPTGAFPESVTISDFDGDGLPDLAVANKGSMSISVFRNTSTAGSLINFLPKMDLATGFESNSIKAGDLDGDGKPDLVVVNNESISTFRNVSTVGNIEFELRVDIVTDATSNSVSIGDFDGDGKSDIAVLNRLANKLSVFRNTSNVGEIAFAGKNDFVTGKGPFSVSVGDLDGDNKIDLVVTNAGDSSVSVLRNTSSASGIISFDPKIDFFAGYFPISNALGDLDGDGKIDLAIASRGLKSVRIMKNISGGVGSINFALPIDYILGTGISLSAISIADLDGDNKLDIAIGNLDSAYVTVLKNTSTETGLIEYNQKVDFVFDNSRATDVTIGDLDGDGQNDLIVTGFNVSIFRNTISETKFKTFSFGEQSKGVSIDSNTSTVDVELVYNADITKLIAAFTLSQGAIATIGLIPQISGTTTNDFTNEVIYTVTAEDGTTTQDWGIINEVIIGLNEKSYNPIIGSAYPNPFKNILKIPILLKENNSLLKVKLINSQGKVVFEEDVKRQAVLEFEYVLDLKNLLHDFSAGFYILKIGVYSKSVAQELTTILYFQEE